METKQEVLVQSGRTLLANLFLGAKKALVEHKERQTIRAIERDVGAEVGGGHALISDYDPTNGVIGIMRINYMNSYTYILNTKGAYAPFQGNERVTGSAANKCRKIREIAIRHNPAFNKLAEIAL